MKVKICGISNIKDLKFCINNGADFCGFILNYPKSHRFISFEKALELTSLKKKETKFVGVLVNPSDEELKVYSRLNLDYFQIYGNYDNKKIIEIKAKYKKKIILSLQIKNKKDILNYKNVKDTADIILWDSSGLEQSVSWEYDWIKSAPDNITKMIAGNIDIDKLEIISKLADIVDVSGALETNKVKDLYKIKKFLEKVKELND
jgi:phosphoribosylanthranilate isomerase|tara:strand:+ start:167 stop:778 length:612 start_codon:yes stop_codon:yes gene_type:complete